jgi:hypothetical protein
LDLGKSANHPQIILFFANKNKQADLSRALKEKLLIG